MHKLRPDKPLGHARRAMTLVEVIISVSLFVFIAAAVCATIVFSLRTFKLSHLDLAAYNLANDLCTQLQLEGYDALARRADAGDNAKKFDDFDKATGSASFAMRSRASATGPTREHLVLFPAGAAPANTNFVTVDTDLLTGTVRGKNADDYETVKKDASRFTFCVRPEYFIETVTDEVSKVPVKIARVRVSVAYPPAASGVPAWLSGDSRRPAVVSAVIASGTNAGSNYLNAVTTE